MWALCITIVQPEAVSLLRSDHVIWHGWRIYSFTLFALTKSNNIPEHRMERSVQNLLMLPGGGIVARPTRATIGNVYMGVGASINQTLSLDTRASLWWRVYVRGIDADRFALRLTIDSARMPPHACIRDNDEPRTVGLLRARRTDGESAC